jgi:hypothetical protein
MTTQYAHDVEVVAEEIGTRLGLPPLDAMRWLLDEMSRTPQVAEPARSLPAAERAALEAVGVHLTAPDVKDVVRQALVRAQARASWLTTSQVADLLGVGDSMVRQRLGSRQLLGEHDPSGAWKIPPWQFADGRIVPHLTTLLPLVPEGLSTVAIERFLTEPNNDLVIDGVAVSPLDWLVCGESPKPLQEMLPALGLTP